MMYNNSRSFFIGCYLLLAVTAVTLSCAESDSDKNNSITPAAPVSVSATDGEYTDKTVIQWASVDNAEIYNIYRKASSDTGYGKVASTDALTYNDTTGVAGTVYSYYITAVADNESPGTLPDDGYRAALLAPAGIVATDKTFGDKIQITWTESDSAELYYIYRAVAPVGPFDTTVGNTASTSIDDTTAVAGTLYYYKVRAYAAALQYSPSSINDVGERNSLPIPADTAASNGTFSDRVRITWTAVSGTVDGYKVYRDTSDTGTFALLGSTSSETYDDTTAVTGTNYYYKVTSYLSSYGESPFGSVVSGSRGVLPAPTGVSASDGTVSDKITVTWNAVTGAASYKVYRDTLVGGAYATLAGSPTTTTLDDTTAVCGTTYYYKVKAVSAASDESALSTYNSGWWGIAAPASISATDGTNLTKVITTWPAAANAESYQVYYSTSDGGTYSLLNGASTTALTADHTNPVLGQIYYYKVRSYSAAAGNSSFSAFDIGYKGFSGPTTLNATVNDTTRAVTLNWSSIAGITNYHVYRYTSAGSPSPLTTSLTSGTLSYTNTPPSGDTYTYRVRATITTSDPNVTTIYGLFTIKEVVTPPATVTASDATYPGQILVQWSAVPGIADTPTYEIWSCDTATGTYTLVPGYTGLTGTQAYISIGVSTVYYFKVRAKTLNSTSALSNYDAGQRQ
jgi:fibronectin type 3 domain-containing protein